MPWMTVTVLEIYVASKSSLRSADKVLLRITRTNLISCGDRSFAVAAPRMWNSLPHSIKCANSLQIFKSSLTCLLKQICGDTMKLHVIG